MRKATLLFLWLATVFAIAVPSLRPQFDSDLWLSRDHPLEKSIDYLDSEFEHGEDLFLMAHTGKEFFSDPSLFSSVEDLEERLSLIPGVISTRSPVSAKTVIQSKGQLRISGFKQSLEDGFIKNSEEYRRLFTDSPYNGKLLSLDGKTFAIRMKVDTRRQAQKRDTLVEAVRSEIKNSPFPSAQLAGDAALQAQINSSVKNELFPLLAACAAVVCVFLFLFLRNRFQVAVLMTCLTVAVAQCIATVNLLGHAFTPVSLCLPLLVCVIVIADGLHIFAIWDKESTGENPDPLRATISATWFPCLLTSLTSAVGFGAFFVSKLVPVSNFGIDSTFAIVLCYPVLISTVWGSLFLFPRRLTRPNRAKAERITPQVLNLYSSFSRRPGKTVIIFSFLCVILASSLLYLRTETNFLNVLFTKSSPIARAFNLADRELGGSGSVEVLIGQTDEGFFGKIENFNRVKNLAGVFNSHTLVKDSASYLLPVEITHRPLSKGGGRLPTRSEELAQEILFLELSRGETEKDILSPYLNFNSSAARVQVQTANLTSSKLATLIAFIKKNSADIFPSAQTVVTGSGAYTLSLSRYVLSTQARSFALTFAVIGVIFVFIFGARLGTAGFISNMFPVLFSTGLLSLLKVPFDFATILIAGVTLGLSVDDSIHFLHHYKRARRSGNGQTDDFIRASLSIVAKPVVITSLLFCLAIAVLCSSSLVVMVKFSVFTVAGLIAAMVSALVFLPSLVRIFDGES